MKQLMPPKDAAAKAEQRTSSKNSPPPPVPPWKVEGTKPPQAERKPELPKQIPSWVKWIGLILLLNWLIAGFVTRPLASTTVNYSVFNAQLNATNVKTVSAKGDSIEGVLKKAIVVTIGDELPMKLLYVLFRLKNQCERKLNRISVFL